LERSSEALPQTDFSFDIMAGHAAGARTVLIVHDTISTMPPHPEPDYHINHLKELISIVSSNPHLN